MALPADAIYKQVLELVKQLPLEKQQDLAEQLGKAALSVAPVAMTAEERKALMRSMQVHVDYVSPDYSDRREDMYGDDGR